MISMVPVHLDIDRERGLTAEWPDGRKSFYPVAHLRQMSPSADSRQLREELARNPLTVLPPSTGSRGPLRIEQAEVVGRYALRLTFSDGHSAGIYSWAYLREIDPGHGGK